LIPFYSGKTDTGDSPAINSHPLYIAVAEIEYSNGDMFATLQCRTFPDDLELALQKQYSQKENIDDPSDAKALSSHMAGYVRQHFQVKINGKQSGFAFINYEKEGDAVQMNLRINNIEPIKTIEVTDNIFYELYNKQINIIYVTVNGNRKNKQLSNPVSEAKFEF
jgi:hypothetical protein